MRSESVLTADSTIETPVEAAHAGGDAPAGPRQAVAGASAGVDFDRVSYVDVVNRWFVAAMLGRGARVAESRPRGSQPAGD